MLPLLVLSIIFLFLAIGASVFVICGVLPQLRKYGLSAALWCATCGPCVVLWMLFGGLAMVANALAMQAAKTKNLRLPVLPNGIGTGYIALGLIGTVVVATVVAWVHQAAIRKMTFALFRIYAGLVSAGIGSVWGWCLWIWLVLDTHLPYRFLLWGLGMVGLCAGFGYAGFRWAKKLRNDSPTMPGLVSQAEFEGLV
jgi:hypothetical protein